MTFSDYIFLAQVFILSIDCGLCETHRHTFTSNTNFDNPNRWTNADHGYPCAGDKIIFTPDQVISVFVQTDATVSEMILPMNGEFIFADGVTWGVSRDLSPCDDEDHEHDVNFLSDADDWFKATNWEVRDSRDVLIKPRDLLDIEKVPCEYDDVKFVQPNSFTADISINTEVKSLSVWNNNFDTTGFKEYRSGDGIYQYTGEGDVAIDRSGCQDATGCVCKKSSSLQAAFSRICSYISCSEASCQKPISAIGSCCNSCGSILAFNYTVSYTEQAMKEYVSNVTTKYFGCHAVLSKVNSDMAEVHQTVFGQQAESYNAAPRADYEDMIQLFITDEGVGSEAGKVAQQMANDIFNELNSPDNTLGVSSINIQSSGPGQSTSNGLSAGAIVGITFGVIIGLFFIILLVLYARRGSTWRGKKFTFSLNDKDTDGLHELYPANITEIGTGSEFESTDDHPNPPKHTKYGTSVDNVGTPQKSVMESDFGVSFGNPAYEDDDI